MPVTSTRSVIAPATTIVVASFALLFSVIRMILNVVSVVDPEVLVSEFEPVDHVPAHWLIPGVVGLFGWVAVIGFAITAMVTDGRLRRNASDGLVVVAALLFALLFGGVVPGSSHEVVTAGIVLLLGLWCVLTARAGARDNLLHGVGRRE